MARFCPQCGAQVRSDSAKFCNGCGGKLRQRQALSPHGTRAQAPPPPPPVACSPPPVSYSPPPAAPSYPTPPSPATYPPPPPPTAYPPTYPPAPAAEVAPAPPQYWESYDYPAQQPDAPARVENWDESYRPADASRPLPPLFLGEPGPGGGGGPAPTDRDAARERAREIARNFALWAAGIVLFPIPFADLVLLMPVQTAMVISISKAYGVKDPPEKVLAHIAAACGASVFGQITTMFVSSFIPIIGKIVTAPFVYGWTYGLGEVAMRYFESQGEINKDEMKQLFKRASKEATRAFKPSEVDQARQTFDHLRDHLSEEDYRKLRERFGGR